MFNFSELNTTANITEEAAPRVGGAGFIVETGCQPCTIVHAYLENAKSGATMLQIRVKTQSGATVDLFGGFGDCIVSGNEKGNKPYYVDKKTGEHKLLPGMQTFANLIKVVLNKDVNQLAPTKQVAVEKYNFDSRKREPMPVAMITELVGKSVIGGFVKNIEDKYNGDGTKEYNSIDQWYNATNKQCAFEVKHGTTEVLHHDKWHESNVNKTRDTSTKTGATQGAPSTDNTVGSSLLSL